MSQKWFTILTIILYIPFFLIACSIPSTLYDESGSESLQNARNIIYVSPNGNDESRGTKRTPLETIQKAISIAKNGDAIKVAPGTYNENIYLRSKMSLIGSGSDVTIITSNKGNIITGKDTFNITIEGFTLDGQDSAQYGLYADGSGLPEWQNNPQASRMIVFKNNTIKNLVNHAIYCQYTGITIEKSNILSIAGIGIHLFRAISKIANNNIWLVNIGIHIQDLGSEVGYNFIRNTRSDGIVCHHMTWVKIEHNKINEAGRNGIQCEYGSPTLKNNYIHKCMSNGIECFGSADRICMPKIRENIITENQLNGILVNTYSQPDIGRSDDIGKNSIYGNEKMSIYSEQARTITAIGNYWGTDPPTPDQFYGSVDYSKALEESPIKDTNTRLGVEPGAK
jgi:hypothetical protein